MNGYVSKPVDDKLLYARIVDLLKKGNPVKEPLRSKYIDLTYLSHRTKANAELMSEMIKLYLDQTPNLIDIMKRSLAIKDWDSIHGAAHKMIPSFSIMGIPQEYENQAKMVQEYSRTKKHLSELPELILRLENICDQACRELTEEYNMLINSKG